MTDQITEKVTDDVVDFNEDSDIAESHSGSEDLFQRWYKEGYDTYDEPYVQWLIINHPDNVRNDWMKKLRDSEKGT